MIRECIVCHGKGNLWGTPRLVNLDSNGPVEHAKAPNLNSSKDNDSTYGLGVLCWRCLGSGLVNDK